MFFATLLWAPFHNVTKHGIIFLSWRGKSRYKRLYYVLMHPGIQFRLPCTPPPGQFFMGAKLFIGTPWMGNDGVLKKKFGLGYVILYGFYGNP